MGDWSLVIGHLPKAITQKLIIQGVIRDACYVAGHFTHHESRSNLAV